MSARHSGVWPAIHGIEYGNFGFSVALVDDAAERQVAQPSPSFRWLILEPDPILVSVREWRAVRLQNVSGCYDSVMQSAQLNRLANEPSGLLGKPLAIAVSGGRILEKGIVLPCKHSQIFERPAFGLCGSFQCAA